MAPGSLMRMGTPHTPTIEWQKFSALVRQTSWANLRSSTCNADDLARAQKLFEQTRSANHPKAARGCGGRGSSWAGTLPEVVPTAANWRPKMGIGPEDSLEKLES